jgi:hypothetical protein
MSILDKLNKQLALLADEHIAWQNPQLQRVMVPIRVHRATRAYREFSTEENNRKVIQGLERFEKFYKS